MVTLSAGQARALRRLEWQLRGSHYRCPRCLTDVAPRVSTAGLGCPQCGAVDQRRPVRLDRQDTRAGFRYVATLVLQGTTPAG